MLVWQSEHSPVLSDPAHCLDWPGGPRQSTCQLSGHVEGLYAKVEVYVHSEAINDCK